MKVPVLQIEVTMCSTDISGHDYIFLFHFSYYLSTEYMIEGILRNFDSSPVGPFLTSLPPLRTGILRKLGNTRKRRRRSEILIN